MKDGKVELTEFQQLAEAAGVGRDLAERFQRILHQSAAPAPVKIIAAPDLSKKSLTSDAGLLRFHSGAGRRAGLGRHCGV